MKKLIALFVFLAIILSVWLWWSVKKDRAAAGFWGDYELASFNCEDCTDCFVRLKPGYIYDVVKNDSIISKGDWDLGMDYQSAMFFLELDYGPKSSKGPYATKIDYLSTINCGIKTCQELLENSFQGKIVAIRLFAEKDYHKTLILKLENGDTLTYRPRSIYHPWLEDTCSVGDILIKKKHVLDYIVVKSNGDSVFLNYEEPDCY